MKGDNVCARCGKKIEGSWGYYDSGHGFYLCKDCAEEIFMALLRTELGYNKKYLGKVMKMIAKTRYRKTKEKLMKEAEK